MLGLALSACYHASTISLYGGDAHTSERAGTHVQILWSLSDLPPLYLNLQYTNALFVSPAKLVDAVHADHCWEF